MKLQIPKDESFLAPEGSFHAVCTEVRPATKYIEGKSEQQVRILFDLEVPGSDESGVQYRAGITYSLDNPKELRAMLKNWFGKSVRGKLLDLDTIRGKPATLQIVHLKKDQHEEAFRLVTKIEPPRQLQINTAPKVIKPEPIDWSTPLDEAA